MYMMEVRQLSGVRLNEGNLIRLLLQNCVDDVRKIVRKNGKTSGMDSITSRSGCFDMEAMHG